MKLRDNLYSETGWEIHETRFDAEQLVNGGSIYMTGNGYLGYRGTFPEWGADQYVGCTVTDTYDTADGKWKELCNVPNALYTVLRLDGTTVSVFDEQLKQYKRSLDFRYGVHRREMAWGEPAAGADESQERLWLRDERFASYADIHLVPFRYEIEAREAGELEIETGIDGEVWSLHGEHFAEYHPLRERDALLLKTVTGETGIEVVVGESTRLYRDGEEVGAQKAELLPPAESGERRLLRRMRISVAAGTRLTLEKCMAVFHSNDRPDPEAGCREALARAGAHGFEGLLEEHQAAWDLRWRKFDIVLDGDERAQALLRYNIYHNIIATPAHTDHLPIGARGLSCQAYQGAAFWDQEIFNLPMFLYCDPETARKVLVYRYRTLDGARKKAQDLGYYGAFYAWVSGDDGREICPSYFFIDVLTGRRIHNHFNDWQIHISPDVGYAVWHYYRVTGDTAFLRDYGAEILLEVSRFLVSHAYFKKDKDRYEFVRLLGPDEYHENVDNNFFTAYQAKYVLERTLESYDLLKEQAPERLSEIIQRIGLTEQTLALMHEMAEKVYVPHPDPETLLIEQFDGYFDMEDITPERLAERLLDSSEYWGWPNGIATETQVTKQADVVQQFMLHPESHSTAVMQANWDYYEPRTQHGSSLSPSVYAVVAAWIGYPQRAYDYFLRSATVDLFNTNKAVSGGTFIGGIHTAACGAAWQIVVHGFLGMRVDPAGELTLDPHLPEQWNGVRCTVTVAGTQLEVYAGPEGVTVGSLDSGQSPVTVRVRDEARQVAGGATEQFSY
jgi:kojibiose phosphorylase